MESLTAPASPAQPALASSHFPPKHVLLDRAVGAVLGGALGDALGQNDNGRWGANTSMAISMLQSMAQGTNLSTEEERRKLVNRWIGWYRRGGQGVDTSTQAVFDGLAELATSQLSAALPDLVRRPWFDAMRGMSEFMGPSYSSGPIARVGPLVLAYLAPGAEAALVETVAALASLSHERTYVGDAAALWALAVRHAILTGEADMASLRAQLMHLPSDRRSTWAAYLDGTEQHILDPSSPIRSDSGQAHVALQQALAAMRRGSDVPSTLQAALDWKQPSHAHNPAAAARSHPAAIQMRNDRAAVGAIAGQLAGAIYGAGSISQGRITELHGFPNDMTADDLRRLVEDMLGRYDRRSL